MPDGYWHGTGTVQVTKELTKLDDCISNIDESLFTNMEAEEEMAAASARVTGGSGAMGNSRPVAADPVSACRARYPILRIFWSTGRYR